MPTYVYQCQKCEHEFEVQHKMSEPGPEQCPVCASPREFLARVIQAVSSILKGGGWYKKGGY